MDSERNSWDVVVVGRVGKEFYKQWKRKKRKFLKYLGRKENF